MTSASQSLLRTLYGIKFLKITIDNASQGFQEMIRDKTILWGYDFHKLIRDKDIFWIRIKRNLRIGPIYYCSLDLVAERTQRS